MISHKVYYKLEIKAVKVKRKISFKEFFDKCYEELKVTEKKENCRLRLYQKFKDEMLDVFDNNNKKSLIKCKLSIAKNFIFEIKLDNEEFEVYDKNVYTVNFVFWDEKVN